MYTVHALKNLLKIIDKCENGDVRIDNDPVIAFTNWNFAFGEFYLGLVLQHNNEVRRITLKVKPDLLERLGKEKIVTTIKRCNEEMSEHCNDEVFEFTECDLNEKVLNEI